MNERVKVAYIGGWGRSGSTLVGNLLGALPGAVSVGEVGFIWTRGVRENQLCGCGAAFHDCPFWTAVGDDAFGGWSSVDVERIVELGSRVQRTKKVPLLAVPRRTRAFNALVQENLAHVDALYRAIVSVSGASVVIDSTKEPTYAFLLYNSRAVDLRLIHLVRDSRAVAYSWTRRVQRPEIVERSVYMDRYPPARSAMRWFLVNSLYEALSVCGVPRVVQRYEDFAREPEKTSARLAAFAFDGISSPDTSAIFSNPRSVQLGSAHTVSGNPMRFKDAVTIRVDDEWRASMPRGARATVSLLSLPMLVRFGYV